MTKFVAGFLFSPDYSQVVLIRKNHGPNDMAGHLNGMGGEIEERDNGRPEVAMSREFLEETGVYIDPELWNCFHEQQFGEHHVTFFKAYSGLFDKVASMTDEVVGIYKTRSVVLEPTLKCYHDVPALVKLAVNSQPLYRYPVLTPVMAYLDIDFKLKNLIR